MASTASESEHGDGHRVAPTLRDEQKSRTRGRLIDSARTLFARQGYAAVRVDDIAGAVGCSRATFYLHFSGKADVLRALAAQSTMPTWREFWADLDRVLDTGSRAEFARWVGRAIAWFHEYRDLLPAWDEAMALDPGFREIARAGIHALPDAMPAYSARWPADRRDEARLRVELFVAQVERFFTRWAEPEAVEFTAEGAAAVITDIWYPALCVPPSGG
ncbi:TetR/AcrR family transcriptional regulator [Nocardia arizonensis]|uniref:TetR/AcrR family transcriptional regulator n=1 Tax=Nocardia arizonensis TaxID=1141647 RepID=UPI0006D14FE1|nr:TetR/AcrR family transcriptional regulator [Nocardia arizonensis]